MPYIDVNGERLFYVVNAGKLRSKRSERGEWSLVLIHGAGGSHLVWPAELRRLGGVTVYALDLPAHGKSDGQGR